MFNVVSHLFRAKYRSIHCNGEIGRVATTAQSRTTSQPYDFSADAPDGPPGRLSTDSLSISPGNEHDVVGRGNHLDVQFQVGARTTSSTNITSMSDTCSIDADIMFGRHPRVVGMKRNMSCAAPSTSPTRSESPTSSPTASPSEATSVKEENNTSCSDDVGTSSSTKAHSIHIDMSDSNQNDAGATRRRRMSWREIVAKLLSMANILACMYCSYTLYRSVMRERAFRNVEIRMKRSERVHRCRYWRKIARARAKHACRKHR